MRRRRALGFTLIELMVAMALAGLVVGGALQLHASFGKQTERQNEVADMQQNLRVAMQLIEREIRNAGYGIPGGMLPEYGSGSGCAATAKRFHYGFEWSNSNTYTDPMTIVTYAAKPASANDLDPDYFWVMSADPAPAIYLNADAANVTTLITSAETLSGLVPAYANHDLFTYVFPTNTKNCTDTTVTPNVSVSCSTPPESANRFNDTLWGHCIREITTLGTGTVRQLTHATTGMTYCFNPLGSDSCALSASSMAPVAIRHIRPVVTAYRVLPASDAYSGGNPKLTRRVAPMNTAYNVGSWDVIAENIDDMQIAVITNSGMICNQSNDPTYNATVGQSCDITTAQAVRITLTARSSSKMEGVNVDTTPYFEDRVAPAVPDPTVVGYLHRSLTAQIELRNMGTGSGL